MRGLVHLPRSHLTHGRYERTRALLWLMALATKAPDFSVVQRVLFSPPALFHVERIDRIDAVRLGLAA